MKKILFTIYCLVLATVSFAQHSINMKLLSVDYSESDLSQHSIAGYELPTTFEYDSENRVTKITQMYSVYVVKETTIDYFESSIQATTTDNYRGETCRWTMTLENDCVVKDEWVRDGVLSEIYLYKYDNQGQLTHIDRQVPVEPDRNMSYDIEWANGQPTLCYEHWENGKYAATLSFDYTSIQDETLVNYFVGLFTYIDNFKSELMPLLYCHNYYGKKATLLPQSFTHRYTIYRSSPSDKASTDTYNYNLDAYNRISSFSHEYSNTTITTILNWDNTIPIINEFTIDNLTYTKLDDGVSVSVAAANNEISGEIVIPTMVRNGGDMYSVTEIGEGGFADCAWLTAITIPDGLTAIGDNAFAGCSGLMQLTVNQEEPPTVSTSAFDGVDKTKCILRVPEGCGEKYRNTPVWRDFWLIAAEGDIIVDGITYAVNDDGTATIVSANHSADGRYVVPSSVTIDGVERTVTEIGANAFSGCTDMTAVTIPETIVALGDHAFADCMNLMEIYVEGKKPAGMKNAFARILVRGIMKRSVSQFEGIDFEKCVLYVPYGSEEAYRETEGWSQFKNIVGVHSEKDPEVTVAVNSYTREYGETNPTFEYTSEGATLEGTPEISCEATATSAVGSYPIVITKGSVANYNDSYVNGTLTITKAPLTVKAKSYTMKQGEALPTFEVEYEGFKNDETAEVLTKLPTIACEATLTSEPGTYDVVVSGAEAENYEISYVKGTLTIEAGTFTLIYQVDGEDYKTVSYVYGTAIMPEIFPTKEGYTFSGWSEIPETMPAKDVTVTGTFTVNKYKLTYMIGNEVYKVVEYDYGATITPEGKPEGDYMTFVWKDVPETMLAKDVTVYADYETGIAEVLMAQGIRYIFSPNGKRIEKLRKGLNIVVMNDGTVRKVVMK